MECTAGPGWVSAQLCVWGGSGGELHRTSTPNPETRALRGCFPKAIESGWTETTQVYSRTTKSMAPLVSSSLIPLASCWELFGGHSTRGIIPVWVDLTTGHRSPGTALIFSHLSLCHIWIRPCVLARKHGQYPSQLHWHFRLSLNRLFNHLTVLAAPGQANRSVLLPAPSLPGGCFSHAGS